jgi:MFS transporter, BCD family, chlorophyll transporter
MQTPMTQAGMSWPGIIRLGLVQTCLGAIVVLTTSTMNRVMVVEYALPAMLPGALVALHYLIQMSRPCFGYGSDVGGRRTPWIIGGMLVMAIGAVGAAAGTAVMGWSTAWGTLIAIAAFVLIGLGVGAAGTSLLALLAKRVSPERRPAAATIVWIMMIAGFALTSGIAGSFLDPFTPARLIAVTAVVAVLAVLLAILALYRLESSAPPAPRQPAPAAGATRASFIAALKEVWKEAEARRFTIFVFISMLAYSAQDLILEPFAGTVFGMTPGESTSLSGVQHSGVMIGMILIALGGSLLKSLKSGILRAGMIGGCGASALALLAISLGGFHPADWPLHASVFALGVANGAFAVAAIGTMMALAGRGRGNREGLRMGLWGAAQAIAFALGGFIGTAAIDLVRVFVADPAVSYALVFSGEAMLFVVAARLGSVVSRSRDAQPGERVDAIARVEYAGMAQERL